ncbi:MAG: metal-dependent hydrolase [Candidatus Kerfeldbacteria bacterium]|nr:metal-dependent hydrolase [Candidatus Kerfeldbacteria bacterium]
MSGKTHAVVGANAVWVAALVYPLGNEVPVLLAIGALAALLPDIDATSAKIHYMGSGALGVFRGVFHHRGFFHSFLAISIIAILTQLFLSSYHPALPMVMILGYASHPIIDGFNKPGVEYFFPWRKRIRLLPKWLTTPVNGVVDQLLFIAGVAGIVFLMTTYSDLFSVANVMLY